MKKIILLTILIILKSSEIFSGTKDNIIIYQAKHRIISGGPAGNSLMHSYEITFLIHNKKSIQLDSLFCSDGATALKIAGIVKGMNFDTVHTISWIKEPLNIEQSQDKHPPTKHKKNHITYFIENRQKIVPIIFTENTTLTTP